MSRCFGGLGAGWSFAERLWGSLCVRVGAGEREFHYERVLAGLIPFGEFSNSSKPARKLTDLGRVGAKHPASHEFRKVSRDRGLHQTSQQSETRGDPGS